MSDLVAFLRARLDEDAVPTYKLVPYDCPPGCCAPEGWVGHQCLICGTAEFGGTRKAMTQVAEDHDRHIHRQARRLAEVEAKRRIIDLHQPSPPVAAVVFLHGPIDPICAADALIYPCDTIKALAQPYADHPGFDPDWGL